MKYNTERFTYNRQQSEMKVGEMVVEVGSWYLYLGEVEDERDPRGVR